MRFWFKEMHQAHLVKETTVEDYEEKNRTKKVFDAIETACREFDLATPVWLEANIKEFKRHGKVRFNQDNFVETIDFDFLELSVLEEDF